MIVPMIIEEIKRQIERSGKSRYQISKETGIDEAALCRIAQGGSCKAETADILLKYFGMRLSKKGGAQVRRHKYRDGEAEANFDELNFKEQAQAITMAINQLGFKIDANLRRAREENRDEGKTLEKRLDQVERMVNKRRSD